MKALAQVFSYSIGSVLTIIAGFVSFPLFTRLLTPADYGVMSLINLTVTILVVFCKCGLQQSLIRFWNTAQHTNRTIFTTALYGSLLLTVATLCVAGAAVTASGLFAKQPDALCYYVITAILVILEVIRSIINNRQRVLQQVLQYNAATTITKYLQIACAAALLIYVAKNVVHLFWGFIIASGVVVAYLLARDASDDIDTSSFNKTVFYEMISFGFPLVLYEFMNQALTFIDRYFIGYFLGGEAVGKYSAAYNLSFYVQSIMITAITMTIYPLVVNLLKEKGKDACRLFLSESLVWFSFFASVVILGFSAVGPDLFILMASNKYADARAVVVPVAVGSYFYGIFSIAVGDMFIGKQTRKMALFMGGAAILNIFMNFWLIPTKGILGAAYATLCAEVLLAAIGLSILRIHRDPNVFLRMISYTFPAWLMLALLQFIPVVANWSSIVIRVAVGAISWATASFMLIPRVRNQLRGIIYR